MLAETCEQNHELLPRVLDKGDRRSLALLAKLSRHFGCGPNKRLDCYPCLRDDKIVDDAMAEAPGPLSADLLYEMWTGTVVRNGATELARSLVFSKEVRAKASAELAVALDLRIAETCEQNKALLPRVVDKGDRRSLALLAKLSRRFGCGANKRLDCYPCLRDDKAVDDAMTAVKKRREPKPFLGK